MGNALPSSGSQDIRMFINTLPSFVYQEMLGKGRFLKSCKCKCEGGTVVVKVYIKRDPTVNLQEYEEVLLHTYRCFSLKDQPNVLPYQRFLEAKKGGSRAVGVGFLVRQFFHCNLYDRLSMRPFLTEFEKLWIAYQLLRALDQAHGAGICHGDIKCDNIVVTSWNWIFLTDFAPFKPATLPSDDPGAFDFFFVSGCRGHSRVPCCVAPERFVDKAPEPVPPASSAVVGAAPPGQAVSPAQSPPAPREGGHSDLELLQRLMDSGLVDDDVVKQELEAAQTTPLEPGRDGSLAERSEAPTASTAAVLGAGLDPLMDVFAAGCVIAELFLDGDPLFDLPELLQFRSHEFDPLGGMLRLPPPVRELVGNMIQHAPGARLTAAECLLRFTGGDALFPGCFRWLHGLLSEMLLPQWSAAGKRVELLCRRFAAIADRCLETIAAEEGAEVDVGADVKFFADWAQSLDDSGATEGDGDGEGLPKEVERGCGDGGCGDPAEVIREIELLLRRPPAEEEATEMEGSEPPPPPPVGGGSGPPPPPPGERSAPMAAEKSAEVARGCVAVCISAVCSALRNISSPRGKVLAVELLCRLSAYSSDDIRFERAIPYLVAALQDPSAVVRASAVAALTAVLMAAKTVPSRDVGIFAKYLLPALHQLLADESLLVQLSLGDSLPKIFHTASLYVQFEACQEQQNLPEGATVVPGSIDEQLSSLRQSLNMLLQKWLSSAVDRDRASNSSIHGSSSLSAGGDPDRTDAGLMYQALLSNITRLCLCFGPHLSETLVLAVLVSFLNEKYGPLKETFFRAMPGVALVAGQASVEQFLLPCVDSSVHDANPLVASAALGCLGELSRLGLIHRRLALERFRGLLLHPSGHVRFGCCSFLCAVAARLGGCDAYVLLHPLIAPLLELPERKVLFHPLGEPLAAEALLQFLKEPCPRDLFEAVLAVLKDRMELFAFPDLPAPVLTELKTECWELSEAQRVAVSMLWPAMKSAATARRNFSRASPGRMDGSLEGAPCSGAAVVNVFRAPRAFAVPFLAAEAAPGSRESGGRGEAQRKAENPRRQSTAGSEYGLFRSSRGNAWTEESDPSGSLLGPRVDASIPSPAKTRSRLSALGVRPLGLELGAVLDPAGLPVCILAPQRSAGEIRTGAPARQGDAVFDMEAHVAHHASWRPNGTLVASLTEHKKAVNFGCCCSDHRLFATGSDDGRVLTWECETLVGDLFPRSSAEHALPRGHRATAGCFLESSRSLCVGSSRGAVDLVRADGGASRLLRRVNLAGQPGVVAVGVVPESVDTVTAVALETARVAGIDWRDRMAACFDLAASPHFGFPTALLVGPDGLWLLVGTAYGYLLLYDMRFRLLVRGWRHSLRRAVRALVGVPQRAPSAPGSRVLVSCGSHEVGLFDLSTRECGFVLRLLPLRPASHADTVGAPRLDEVPLDALLPPSLGFKTVRRTVRQALHSQGLLGGAEDLAAGPDAVFSDSAIRAVALGSTSECSATTGMPPCVFTAGADRCVRCWDTEDCSRSRLVCGLDRGERAHSFEAPSRPPVPTQLCRVPPSLRDGVALAPEMEGRGGVRPSEAHVDCILGLEVVELPRKVVVSCGRDAVVKVWR